MELERVSFSQVIQFFHPLPEDETPIDSFDWVKGLGGSLQILGSAAKGPRVRCLTRHGVSARQLQRPDNREAHCL